MKRIALRYTEENLSSMTFDSVATNQKTYETIRMTAPIPVVVRENGILLNGRQYSHHLYSHNEIEITISTDELSTSDIDFLINFYKSNYQYISINNITFGNYIKVITEAGKFPLEYLNDIKYLPEIKFKLNYENPI
jgi:hypothetical protein